MNRRDKSLWESIRAARVVNNDLFVDWMMVSFDCPRCAPWVRLLHKNIVWNDQHVTDTAKELHTRNKKPAAKQKGSARLRRAKVSRRVRG